MTTRATITSICIRLIAVFGLLIAGGCSMQYNGAFGGAEDYEDDPELQKFKEELKKKRAIAKRQEAQVDFASGQTGTHSALAHTGGASTATVPVSHQNIATPLRGMGLYGDLPRHRQQHAFSSPQDSPHNLSQVTFITEGADFDPDIDPTGQWMVFASTRHRKTSEIYRKKVDGNTVQKLTEDPANDVMPDYSPDGRWIAFASDRAGNWDIYLMPADGSGPPRPLTNAQTHEMHPSFSPDGKLLVYSSYGAQSGQWEIVVMDLANPAQKKHIAHGLFPNWSPVPGDNRIVYQKARERGSRWFSVWTMEYVNGEATRPTEIASSANAAVITPDWSPDAQHIVFCTVVDPQADEKGATPPQADVWMIAADGSSRANLTQSTRFVNLQPVWARGGTIYFVSNRGRNAQENVWSVNPDKALQLVQPRPHHRPIINERTVTVPPRKTSQAPVNPKATTPAVQGKLPGTIRRVPTPVTPGIPAKTAVKPATPTTPTTPATTTKPPVTTTPKLPVATVPTNDPQK